MLRYVIMFLLLLLLFQLSAQPGSADAVQCKITTQDGNTFIGYVIEENSQRIKFKTFTYGLIVIPKTLIVSTDSLQYQKIGISSETSFSLKDTSLQWHIVTDDGFDFFGIITHKTDQIIELKTNKYGTIKINRLNIKNMQVLQSDQIVGGEVWFENPQGARYFYSPTGYGLKANEGYYQNVWVLMNQFSYGFTDYFTMGFGTIPMFLFGDAVFPFWITPKFSFPIVKDKINAGGGILLGGIYGVEENATMGLAYGVVTYGSKDRNVNLGAGYAFADGKWAKHPVFTASALVRLNKKSYFISENYMISIERETVVLLSFGGRTIWPRVSLDYGLLVPLMKDIDSFVAVPWLGFVIPFGNYSGSGNKINE